LLALGAYVVIGEHLSGVSSDAAINARTTVVRAPIEGELKLKVSGIGVRVSAGETLGDINDTRVDSGRLADLKRSEATLQADLARIMRQREILTKTRQDAAAHAAEYQGGRISQLEAKLAEAKAMGDAAAARLREHDNALQRANALNERGVQTAANLDHAKSTRDVSVEDQKVSKQKVSYVTVELAAARNGVFLGDSYNDSPYSLQQVREMDLRLAENQSEAQHAEQRLSQVQDQAAAETRRINRLTSTDIKAPTSGLVWSYQSNDGEVARKGQDLLRLVDCTSVMITASVSERLYNSLKQGDSAQFRLLGDDRSFEGTITRLGGSGAANLYDNLAVGPTPEHLKGYDVTLSVPGLLADPQLGCAVGRTGRVVFSASPASKLRYLTAQLGAQLGMK